MNGELSMRLAGTASFARKIWRLTAPYWVTTETAEVGVFGRSIRVPERWIARVLLAIVLVLNIGIVWILKLLNDWYARFYNALEQKDTDVFWVEIRYFAVVAALYIVVAVYRIWFRQMLQIRWRRWLTNVYYREWLRDRTYYRLELTGTTSDNPEQRIQEDCDNFTHQTLTIVLGLISEVLTLVTFTLILWNLSGSVTLPIFGGVEIPGYMMWAAILYAVAGSWLTYKIGRSLVRVNFDLQRSNADFRYRMIRVRENAESIALYGGEPDEVRRLDGSFQTVYRIWWDFMRYNKRLVWFTSFYGQAATIFPFVVAAPRYFTGDITLGVLMQTASAFGTVQSSLSWFVETFPSLAEWKATTDRLTGFGEAMAAAKQAQRAERRFDMADGDAGALVLEDVEVDLPDGRVLLRDVDLTLERGRSLVIQGPSGSGKTTLFRVIAGIWPFGRGRLRLPRDARVLFLPQRPYLPLGTLKDALTYPDHADAHGEDACVQALEACRLPHLAARLDETGNWAMTLSPGEQQRLAFARALLYRPDWLFLDEASSALDEATEREIYRTIKERLPAVTLISIAHKPGVLAFHDARVSIDPALGRVRLEALPQAES